jgi:hypothetical protein
MPSKPSSPGPNPATTTPVAKQARSRKVATPNTDAGRAGSAGGIVLEKEKEAKSKAIPKPKPTQTTTEDAANDASKSTPRRKPRKLNKEPANTTAIPASTSKEPGSVETPSATEIEALKSRVRGLEAKVEELYKSGSLDRPGRSPRRRGKGRKASSQQQVPTLSTTKPTIDDDDDVEEIGRGDDAEEEEEGVEELVRLEGELEVARQDLAAFKPQPRKTRRVNEDEEEDVEEISRDETDASSGNGRHVTLSGSYRIPLPASVSVDDVKHIQSGVSAAQNVARSFLEQRRAAASISSSPKPSTSNSQATPKATNTNTKKSARPTPKSVSSSMEVIPAEDADGKKSWSEWIGGYSVAISRAVKNIEHEAAVESQRAGAGGGGAGGSSGPKKKAVQGTGKRPGVKTKMSGEQVNGLMS